MMHIVDSFNIILVELFKNCKVLVLGFNRRIYGLVCGEAIMRRKWLFRSGNKSKQLCPLSYTK